MNSGDSDSVETIASTGQYDLKTAYITVPAPFCLLDTLEKISNTHLNFL